MSPMVRFDKAGHVLCGNDESCDPEIGYEIGKISTCWNGGAGLRRWRAAKNAGLTVRIVFIWTKEIYICDIESSDTKIDEVR